ncbi:nucleic acid/nucleotide deaminase domain-containing protein [Streptomyces sp. NPDC048825]|uniref:nucleic acid/nucleotide deaminase domain-containing protein n=1 Tax=Streptomyces sp. NPDC048825 TaxID=3365592 RepID=UPI003714D2E9
MPVPDPAVAHFGRDGMRRISATGAYGVRLPENSRATLEGVGVPLHVAPYFRASGKEDALALGVFAGHHGLPRPATESERWLRIGTDGLAHLCVRPDGALQAVFLENNEYDGAEPGMFVSSDITAFNASLVVLDRRLPVIAVSPGLSVAAAAFRELNAELRQIDAAAFAERESWWPRVLDDVRHSLNFPFSSAFEYVDEAGEKQTVTDATGPGRAHPEELIWQRLSGEGIAPEQVRRVYCELEPCMMPGHYCAVWMQRTFPQAEFTHSFDYGSDAESREAGLKELITHAARQAGGR